MSADLFAEFNDLASNPAPASQSAQAIPPAVPSPAPGRSGHLVAPGQRVSSRSQSEEGPPAQWPSEVSSWAAFTPPPQPPHHAMVGDDDGWGDFEVAGSTPSSNVSQIRIPSEVKAQQPASSQGAYSPGALNSAPPSHELHMGSLWTSVSKPIDLSWSQPQVEPESRTHAGPSDPNVLFDADDFELSAAEPGEDEADEFGDFAMAAQPVPRHLVASAPRVDLAPSVDLLGLEDVSQSLSQENKGLVNKPAGALSFGGMASSHTPPNHMTPGHGRISPSKVGETPSGKSNLHAKDQRCQAAGARPAAVATNPKQPFEDEDDDWGAWDDISVADSSINPISTGAQPPVDREKGLVVTEKPAATEASVYGPPPINIPPPSVLLSAFPELFNSANSFKSVAGQPLAIKQRVLSDPKAGEFLRGYVLLGTTAARIMAGRKLRWHRDKLLAKSMSISAAGSKGMKLAGVDKTQSSREDRESADVVATWREQVGMLRAAIATANAKDKEVSESPS